MTRNFDVIVIGQGVMGAATSWQLARRGVRVLGLEQFSVPNVRGSSHGQSRMIRLCYYEHPDYVPLLRRAYTLWEELEQESARKTLYVTGGVYAGRAESEFVAGALRSAQKHHLPHEMLSHSELASRYPQLTLPDDHVALYEPAAGFILADLAVSTFAELALRHGGEIHGHESVVSWEESDDGVIVTTDRDTYRARKLVVCAGPWASHMLEGLGVRLRVTRQPLGWFWPKDPGQFDVGQLPVWAVGQDDGSLFYGFPLLPGSPGLKLGHHKEGAELIPGDATDAPRPEDEAPLRSALERFMPMASGPLLSMRMCRYTSSPDSHFILDLAPGSRNVMVACAFSGHGFKFGPVIGEILADMALSGSTDLPASFLGVSRFGS